MPRVIIASKIPLLSLKKIDLVLQARQLLEKEYNALISMGTERRPDEVSRKSYDNHFLDGMSLRLKSL